MTTNLLGGIAERERIVQLRKKPSLVVSNFQSAHNDLFFKVNLSIPKKEGALSDWRQPQRVNFEKIVTSKGLVSIDELSDNAMIGFDLTISYVASTEFTHDILIHSNDAAFEATIVQNWTIYANAKHVDLRGLENILGIDAKRLQGYLSSKFKAMVQRVLADKKEFVQWDRRNDLRLPVNLIEATPQTSVVTTVKTATPKTEKVKVS